MLGHIADALDEVTNRVEKGDGEVDLTHFADEESAFRFIANVLSAYGATAGEKSNPIAVAEIFGATLVPLHKWLQAVFLTDGGTVAIEPRVLAWIVEIPTDVAVTLLRKLGQARLRM